MAQGTIVHIFEVAESGRTGRFIGTGCLVDQRVVVTLRARDGRTAVPRGLRLGIGGHGAVDVIDVDSVTHLATEGGSRVLALELARPTDVPVLADSDPSPDASAADYVGALTQRCLAEGATLGVTDARTAAGPQLSSLDAADAGTDEALDYPPGIGLMCRLFGIGCPPEDS